MPRLSAAAGPRPRRLTSAGSACSRLAPRDSSRFSVVLAPSVPPRSRMALRRGRRITRTRGQFPSASARCPAPAVATRPSSLRHRHGHGHGCERNRHGTPRRGGIHRWVGRVRAAGASLRPRQPPFDRGSLIRFAGRSRGRQRRFADTQHVATRATVGPGRPRAIAGTVADASIGAAASARSADCLEALALASASRGFVLCVSASNECLPERQRRISACP